MATRDIVYEHFSERFGPEGAGGENLPLITVFGHGWEAAISYVLHHEQRYGHEWVQAMGFAPGKCDDCFNEQD